MPLLQGSTARLNRDYPRCPELAARVMARIQTAWRTRPPRAWLADGHPRAGDPAHLPNRCSPRSGGVGFRRSGVGGALRRADETTEKEETSMPTPSIETARGWLGRVVVDRDGDKVGEVVDIYLDNQTGRPEWAVVR